MARFLITMLPANDLGLPTRMPSGGRLPIAATRSRFSIPRLRPAD
jgi:hypothetical protein